MYKRYVKRTSAFNYKHKLVYASILTRMKTSTHSMTYYLTKVTKIISPAMELDSLGIFEVLVAKRSHFTLMDLVLQQNKIMCCEDLSTIREKKISLCSRLSLSRTPVIQILPQVDLYSGPWSRISVINQSIIGTKHN